MKCTRCGNEDCQIITETNTYTKGYGLGKGCLGYLIFGPIGFLCGLCGMGKSRSSTIHYYLCHRCGKRFRA